MSVGCVTPKCACYLFGSFQVNEYLGYSLFWHKKRHIGYIIWPCAPRGPPQSVLQALHLVVSVWRSAVDYAAQRSIDDYLTGEDPELELALKLARKI